MRSSRCSSNRCQRAHSCRWRVPRHQREEYPVPPRREHPMLPAPKPQRERQVSPKCPVLPPKKESPVLQLPPKSSASQPPSERECPAQPGRECTAMPVKEYLPPRPTERYHGGGGNGTYQSFPGTHDGSRRPCYSHQEETVLCYQRESASCRQSPREISPRRQSPREGALHHQSPRKRETSITAQERMPPSLQQPDSEVDVGAVLAILCPTVWRGAAVPGSPDPGVTAIQDWHGGSEIGGCPGAP
ncbi:UNVERIFIED_CONTAM: hypothetical protein FKN15_065461 [Acipenser sinensis]